jgi:hypothetical protein
MNYLNYTKVFGISLLNLAMIGFVFYLSFMFSAVYKEWAHNLLIIWALCLVFDFIVFEIINEVIILILFSMRNLCTPIKYAMRILLALKNLRNITI